MSDDVVNPLSLTGKVIPVPEDLLALSRDTNIPLADSPESLDHDVAMSVIEETIEIEDDTNPAH